MPADFTFRTESIHPTEILSHYANTRVDREIVDALKSRDLCLVEGSRGVGKSMLLRVAEAELNEGLSADTVLPVYVSLDRVALLNTANEAEVRQYVLARLARQIVRAVRKRGLTATVAPQIQLLGGRPDGAPGPVDAIVDRFEASVFEFNDHTRVDVSGLPEAAEIRDACEDLCEAADLRRVAAFFDEAVHTLRTDQQREFFPLIRDLNSPTLTCHAAVYPGVTNYGAFDPSQDARRLSLDRDVESADYVDHMREIVSHHATAVEADAEKNPEAFESLAYAATGNPRVLLKTLALRPKLNARNARTAIKEYYRDTIWADHDRLAERYPGHRALINWGRDWVLGRLIPALVERNQDALSDDGATSRYFWVQHGADPTVAEGLRLLTYTGVLSRGPDVVATRNWLGTRYALNLGVLFNALNVTPETAVQVARRLSVSEMVLFGKDHPHLDPISGPDALLPAPERADMLVGLLQRPVSDLDLTAWQKRKLVESGRDTVEAVLIATEEDLRQIYQVGPVRSRQMRHAAQAAIVEYLSG